jgi:ribosomal-protein-alanine N-acetyltransferase
MAAAPELLTPRLRLRPLAVADAKVMAALMTPGISRWTGSLPGTLSRAQAAERLGVIVQAMEAGDDVTLAIELRAAPGFIGWIGLRRLGETPERAALGYWIGEAFHGQGYTREAARAFLPAAWAWLDVEVVEAVAQHGNAASLAILRGLGMTPKGERMTYSPVRDREEACLVFEAQRPA